LVADVAIHGAKVVGLQVIRLGSCLKIPRMGGVIIYLSRL
jgi:hypothetical protein